MKKVEIIDRSQEHICYKCSGKGIIKGKKVKCDVCNATGIWLETGYILVAKQPNGQRIAFSVDNPGA